MGWVFFGLSLLGALLTLNALRPPRLPSLGGIAFPPGWLVSELPLHLLVFEAVATIGFAFAGAFSGGDAAPGYIGLAFTAVSCGGLVTLALSGARAAAAYDAALGALAAERAAQGLWPPADRRHRGRLLRLVRAFPFRPSAVERVRNLDYAGDGRSYHRLDVFRPAGGAAGPAPVVLYIHGGAWTIGDKREQALPMMHHLASRGTVCFTANYRLSPRATWPAHIDDCRLALAWVREHAAEYGGDPDRIVLVGGSAGGHLAALLALDPGLGADGAPLPNVAGCVGLYGVYDFTAAELGHGPQLLRLLERTVMKLRRDDEPDVFAAASPRSYVRRDAPPFLIVHGRNDTLVPVSTARAFSAALSEVSAAPVAYVELPFAQHAFELFWSLRTVATALAIEEFVFNLVVPVRGH